jgi:hypothetical protein
MITDNNTVEPIRSITIFGRRWRDQNANTYFSASILVNGVFVHRIRKEYGYGDQYFQASMDWLKAAQMFEVPEGASPWSFCEEHNINLHFEVADVARRSDLF